MPDTGDEQAPAVAVPAPATEVYLGPAGAGVPAGDLAEAGWVDAGWTTDDGLVPGPGTFVTEPQIAPYIAYHPGGLVSGGRVSPPGRAVDFMDYNRDRLTDYFHTHLASGLGISHLWQADRRPVPATLGEGGFHNPAPGRAAAIDASVDTDAAERIIAAINEWVAAVHVPDPAMGSDTGEEDRPESYATRATAPARAADDGVDDLTAAIEGRCACPCRRPLDPAGASAYFATAACQRNWHGAQATDPNDVYRREDAARTVVGADSYDPPLTPGSRRERPPSRSRGPSRATSRGLEWRRWCDRCGVATRPESRDGPAVTGVRPGPRDQTATSTTVHVDTEDDRWQQCATCGYRFPGPPLTARIDLVDNDDWSFRLTDGTLWAAVTVDRARLADEFDGRPTRRRAFIDLVWVRLEDELLRRIAARRVRRTGSLSFEERAERRLRDRRILFEQRLAMSVMPRAPFLPVTGI